MKCTDKQDFWDRKIVGWEGDKYSEPKGILGRLVNVNSSLKNRLRIAESVLQQIAKDRIILEIGCGTARLLPVMAQLGVSKYIGVDISRVALEKARALAQTLGLGNTAEFHHLDATRLVGFSPDFCFSLGLLDWMEPSEIVKMIRQVRCPYYLHSFSEFRRSVQQFLHRLYVHFMYGHRTQSYVPRYYRRSQIIDIFADGYGGTPKVYHCKKLSFGSFVYCLPDEIQFDRLMS